MECFKAIVYHETIPRKACQNWEDKANAIRKTYIIIDDDERLWQWLVNVNYINPLSAQGSPTVVDHDRCHLLRPFHNGNDEENDG